MQVGIKMKRVIDHNEILKLLSHCNKNTRSIIIQKGNKEFIYSICECILNVLNGNVILTEQQIKELKPYKQSLRKLLKNNSIKIKKKLLIQKGGFLQIILPSIIAGLATIISSTIAKKREEE